MLRWARNRPPDDEPSEEIDAPAGYVDLQRIDSGGFSSVYTASQVRMGGRVVALKILNGSRWDRQAVQEFRRECRALGKIPEHPYIVTAYDSGTTPRGRPFLAMKYCTGGSLAFRLGTQGPLSASEVIELGTKMADALGAAHSANVLHLDVKPGNILMTTRGEPSLADFGVARLLDSARSGPLDVFTLEHAAPEVIRGQEPTSAADIYSLGSTLYALLAGRSVYSAEAHERDSVLLARILTEEFPKFPKPDIPPRLREVLQKAMASEPARRYGSAPEFAEALASIVSASIGPASADSISGEIVDPRTDLRFTRSGQGGRLVPSEVGAAATRQRSPAAGRPAPPSDPPAASGSRRRLPWVIAASILVVAGASAGVIASLNPRGSTASPSGTPPASTTPTAEPSPIYTTMTDAEASAVLPQDVQADVGPDWALVSWIPAVGAGPQGVSLQTTRADGNQLVPEPIAVERDATSVAVEGLVAGAEYCFTLYAFTVELPDDGGPPVIRTASTDPVCAIPTAIGLSPGAGS